jgi:UDP-N-acetylglucosamine--N-acetylmuramyl-(pentapeptide) pyrophosphoryl-undecaprenol N-acetylglucosamine transferase
MNIIIAGGGTGGHLFPGIAIAQEFMRRNPQDRIVFIGSTQGIEARLLPQLGFALKTLPIRGFSGKPPAEKLAALALVPAAFLQAGRYLRSLQADIVVGLGGYSSFPAVAAARLMGIPAVIHEQNSVPGLTNRILGRMARRVFVTFEASRQFFPASKTTVSGLPVRSQFSGQQPRDDGRFCVFVCGGSQGAHAINEALAAALPLLRGMSGQLHFIHQSGQADCAMLRQQYEQCGFSAEVLPFIDDMAACYRRAHLVICRAGASTLAELALCGKASILIPYPFAAGNHQELNARVFADRGACMLLLQKDLSAEALAGLVQELAAKPETCRRLGRQAGTLAQPQAAGTIVEACCRLAA